MIHNIPLVLLGDDGTILNAIESQRGRVSVARSAHTFADALGYAHAGIACAILSVGLPQEATVSILHELDEADVKFIALVPEDTPLPDLVMPLATDTEPHQLPAVVEKLLDEASAEPEQELGITPQKAENGYGYDSGYSGHYGYDTQNLYNG
ncbi:MAG: regulator, partial [Rothia dentocariosa]